MDKFLTTCSRCSSSACYITLSEGTEVSVKTCFSCGFTTSDLMQKDSILYKNTFNTLPELYKDLEYIDSEGYVWFPATVSLPAKGMVFLDGTDQHNWRWAAVQAVVIQESEREKYPKDQTHKSDMSNIKYFDQFNFMDALEAINFFSLD